MCGIFGYVGSQNSAATLVLDGLKQLEYRGYDSWGVAVIPSSQENEKKIIVKKRVGKIGGANVSDLPAGSLALGHTRWATHGGVTEANAHPHMDCLGKIAVVHNGIFENYEEEKKNLLAKGHTFLSETDSEVIAHLLEEATKDAPFEDAVRAVFTHMDGLNALIAINTEERVLVAARNGSPLVIGFGEHENFLASDPAALLLHTKSVYFLEDGEMASVKDNSVVVKHIQTGEVIAVTPQILEWDMSQAEKGEYAHYMLKEIHEQPKILREIVLNSGKYTEEVAQRLQAASNLFFVGCGTSSYEALVSKYLFSLIAHIHSTSEIGSEFQYDLGFLNATSAVVALSQSGETMDILEPLKKAKAQGASIIALVNVLGSSLYRLADEKILIGAGPEKAVASTKAFSAKIAHVILLAYAAADKFSEGKEVLLRAAEASEALLSPNGIEKIQHLAHLLAQQKDIYIIGRGLSYPVSLEAAIKIKEVSYIHAEGLAGGELKHGPLALIEQGTPCIAFIPDDETYQATLAGAMEMKARGGFLIGVSSKLHQIFDYTIEIVDAREANIIPNVIFAQLLSYYLALELKLDPDMPRNLAKSVTVK